jgi:hypothetical protein
MNTIRKSITLLAFLALAGLGNTVAQTGARQNQFTENISMSNAGNKDGTYYLLLCKLQPNVSSKMLGTFTIEKVSNDSIRNFQNLCSIEVFVSSTDNKMVINNLSSDVNANMVIVQYNGDDYSAIKFDDLMNVANISFSGSAENKSLLLVSANQISENSNTRGNATTSSGDPWQETTNGIYYTGGNVGIGTIFPQGKLHVVDYEKNYYVNKIIHGNTDDNISVNYLLLHQMYDGTIIQDHYVMGKIAAERGSIGAWNRKWTIEVNTASAYATNRGSMISYNESSRLVTLQYAGKKYIAAEIAKNSKLMYFSFTGYARNEMLMLVTASNVSNVQSFNEKDPININGGDLFIGSNIGIGTDSPTAKLTVAGNILAREVKVDANAGADFVFAPDYNLRSLSEVEQFITENKHLPDIAPADEMIQNGVNMGEFQIQLLQKIEELTLYVIELKKENEAQQKEIEILKQKNE